MDFLSFMCNNHIKHNKIRLADIYSACFDRYAKNPKEFIKPEVYRAVYQTLACRTPKLGTSIYCCPGCHKKQLVYHSCKNRFCPTCGYSDTNKWAKNILPKLINCKHHHIIFTLPASLRLIAKANIKVIHSLILKASAETMIDWFNARYNTRPGIISVLHTAGGSQKYHLHVHMLCTAGGIDNKNKKFKPTEDKWYLIRQDFLAKKFRWHFENLLFKVFNNDLLFTPYDNIYEFKSFIKEVNKQEWVCSVQPPLDNPESIVRYVGRYTKRACLSEYNIKEFDGEYISFQYKDNRDKGHNGLPKIKIIKLHYRDFFARLFQHVPPKSFRMARYYGVYSHKLINTISKELKQNTPTGQTNYTWRQYQIIKTGVDPLFCNDCKKELVYVYTLFDGRKRRWRRNKKFKIPDFYPNYEFERVKYA